MEYQSDKENKYRNNGEDYHHKNDGYPPHHKEDFHGGNLIGIIIGIIIIIIIICFIAWAVYASSNVGCGSKGGKWGGDGY